MTINSLLDMIRRPAQFWDSLSARETEEPIPAIRLALLFALIPAVCRLCGIQLHYADNAYVNTTLFSTALVAIKTYVLFLVTPLLLARLLLWVVPLFKGEADLEATTRLAIYGAVPVWIAGLLFLLAPYFDPLVLIVGLGAASYLFYLGCQKLLGIGIDMAVGLTIIHGAAWLIVYFTLYFVIMALGIR
ncbi:Yip1 family protein [Parasphingopyxis marina]|uniref:YIP1 family protein n=1 Tax=Parasphingopyxis marina TaxID=2761622 RepID=A0A842HXJ7_9SPHN|nr:Yip1 family protein [Parasphingopyxis marina]MBC2777672.1 YIP1 family protein [Parasphingopyxis marina]